MSNFINGFEKKAFMFGSAGMDAHMMAVDQNQQMINQQMIQHHMDNARISDYLLHNLLRRDKKTDNKKTAGIVKVAGIFLTAYGKTHDGKERELMGSKSGSWLLGLVDEKNPANSMLSQELELKKLSPEQTHTWAKHFKESIDPHFDAYKQGFLKTYRGGKTSPAEEDAFQSEHAEMHRGADRLLEAVKSGKYKYFRIGHV